MTMLRTSALAACGVHLGGLASKVVELAAQDEAERARLIWLICALGPQSAASVSDLFDRMRGVPTRQIRDAADAILAGEDGAYERVQSLLDGRPLEQAAAPTTGARHPGQEALTVVGRP